ncbi:hypothetical protein BC936DRAFT_148543 [Jimgerdemannia flammicorona]|uniref:C3H1-type domain-containing protein n=1 Tax=Jimgerdemannia flammicorona TaxID=994334 RepID=A0A433D2U8_9FUNG|nr:hypothetical protein BC936DRAFT_148543 [Jimgerdemannia flammicorona]
MFHNGYVTQSRKQQQLTELKELAPRKRLRYFMNTIEIVSVFTSVTGIYPLAKSPLVCTRLLVFNSHARTIKPLLRKAVSRLESVDRPAKKTSTVPNIQREVPKTKAVTDTGFFDTLLATSQTKTSMPSKSAVSNQISIGSNNRIPKLGYTLKPPTSQPKKTPMLSIDSILETWNASKTSTAIDQSQLGAQSGGDTTSNTLITNSEDVVSTKKRKKVTWASGDELEKIKIFESDPDELGSEMYGLGTPHEFGNARDMDINEAKAAFHSDMQATMDWYPPAAIWFPDNFPVLDVIISEETKTQTLREQVALAAVYFTETHIPSSPAEPDEIPNDNLLNVRVIPLTDESEAPYITPIPTLVMPTSSGILSLSNTGIVNDALGSSGTLPTIVSTSIAQQVPVSTASVDLSLLASMSATQLASILGARTTPTATDVTSSVSGVTPNHTIPVSHLTSVGNSPQVAGSNMYQGASTNPPEQPQPQPQLVHQLLQSPALMHEFLAQLGQLQTPPQATAPQHSRQQDYHMQQPLQHDYRPSSTQDYRTEEIYSDDYDGYDAEPSSRSGRLTPQDRERDRAYGFGRGRGNAMNTPCRFYAMGRCLKGSHCAFKH